MRKKESQEKKKTRKKGKKEEPGYEEPKVITYSGDELLKELGPAQACRAFGCPVAP